MKRANEFLFFADLMVDVMKGLREGRTVTEYLFEGRPTPEMSKDDDIVFEVRVKRYGAKKLLRITDADVRRYLASQAAQGEQG